MNPNNRGVQIVEELLNNFSLPSDASPSEFLDFYWKKYKDNYRRGNHSLNGTVFENFVLLALAREGIDNIYYQAELTYVPSATFDVFLYSPEKPIALSLKTSLRERWKQADLEALAFKQVHKNASCFVLTPSNSEVLTRRKRSNNFAGLDGFILANTNEFDSFVDDLKCMQFDIAGSSPIVKKRRSCYTANELRNQFNL